ncbi:hypothetical protein POREN0001_0023 [Porphyromonas endodontalis ATCC 35406]|uniref:Uncharacterized protein n=1 Tax=Porphyromonas endodontalis (strain ATCC 35406 / DSM 24491 / JCM 8526 / CCUG 16442 / BCRC 14492 / NCTC 13058 / HG 370) TaxID=553175 RepID=C3JCJ7_POREA|nr:hypothetical protein POREN0001_0023 [Porphyromonas endodontalis ATCC 35406]
MKSISAPLFLCLDKNQSILSRIAIVNSLKRVSLPSNEGYRFV